MPAVGVRRGGGTYQQFAGYWPQQGSDVPFADHLSNVPKLVVSTTPRTFGTGVLALTYQPADG